jgi:hypothetical protein
MPAGGLIPDSPWIWGAQRLMRGRRRGNQRGVFSGGGKFSFTISKVIIYDAKLHSFLNTRSGPLWDHLDIRLQKAVAGAKRDAYGSKGYGTGALSNSIKSYHLGNAKGQFLGIRAEKPYASAVHEGAMPHVIRPKDPNGKLVFFKGGRMIVTRQVNHPGIQQKSTTKYLSAQLRHFLD